MTRLGLHFAWVLAAAIVPAACEEMPAPSVDAAVAPASSTPESSMPGSSAPGATPTDRYLEDVAAAAGIDFVLETRLDDRPWLPEIVAGGVGAGDFDGDGRVDLYFVQGTGDRGNRLFRNLGGWRFEDATEGSGAADAERFGMGVATGDYDGDGDLDLYLTNLGPDTLLRNDGNLVFTDVTSEAGLGQTGFGASATFFDADRDGDLDLFVTNYVDWSPERELDCRRASGERDYCAPDRYGAPSVDVLYRNRGDGTFVDASAASGITTAVGTGLGVVATDVDGDGLLDLFVANDGMPDHLWMNRGEWRFEEMATRAGCDRDLSGVPKAGMGVTVEDLDDDGDPDILVCNLGGETDSLHLNDGEGRFVDATNRRGLAAPTRRYTRFGLAFLDIDLDGHLDLYAATGRVGVGGRTFDPADPYAEPDLLLRGSPSGRFESIERDGGFVPAIRTSRGLAVADFDDDGRADLVVVDREAPARLLRNISERAGRWIGIDLRDAGGGPAMGARIEIECGDRVVTRWVRTDSSYLSARDPRIQVGLGEPDLEQVAATVTWLDGRRRRFEDLELDRWHHLVDADPSGVSAEAGGA